VLAHRGKPDSVHPIEATVGCTGIVSSACRRETGDLSVMTGTHLSTRVRLAAAFAAGLFAIAPGPADAAGIACPGAYSGGVSPSTACQVGGAHNDFLDPLQVNEDSLFGFDDWVFAGKALESDTDAATVDIGFGAVGTNLSGEWFVDGGVWTDPGISHLMLVLKGGRPHQPGGFLAYLIETGATEGTYVSPFVNLNNPQAGFTGISHISAYVRAQPTDVPEPASVTLVGFGLLATAASLRRRSRA